MQGHMELDFVQAAYCCHRHYILCSVGQELEEALTRCGPDEVMLRVFLSPSVFAIVESARLHGGRFESDPGVLAPTRYTVDVGVGSIIGPTNSPLVNYAWSQRTLEYERQHGYTSQRIGG